MLCGDIYAKRKNGLGPGSTAAVSCYCRVLGALSAPQAAESIHARAVGLSLQSLTSTRPVLCARRWPCWFDQFPASCWAPRGRSIISGLCMCHPGIQNHRCLPPLGWCSPPPSPTINLFFLKFAHVDFEETPYLSRALAWDVLCKYTCGT